MHTPRQETQVKITDRRSRIVKNNAPGLDKIMKEIVWFTHFLIGVLLVIPVAGLVPGDRVNLNVIGSLGLIVLLVALDAVITVPCTLWRRKINRPVLAPVRIRSRW